MVDPIGFIGLGNMGVPMVRNLAGAGHEVVALDLSAERRSLVRPLDRVTTTTAFDDLSQCSSVILMLPNGNIVRDVLVGSGDLASHLPRGSLVIDMSSSDPIAYEEIGPRLASRDIELIDAPVSGNVSGAVAGSLTIMVGGDVGALDRARPILKVLGNAVFHTGALGTGQVMKALNNLLSAGGLMMAIEVLLTAKAAGLDPAQVTEILNISTGRNNSTERKIVPFILSGEYNSGFGLSLMAKDLRTAGSIAERLGISMPVANHAIEAADKAEAELETGADHTEVARWLQQVTGQKFD